MTRKAVIVGHSTTTLCDHRQFIDSCDEVIRFSCCYGLGGRNGIKTTRWVTRSYCIHTARPGYPFWWGGEPKEILKSLSTISTAYVTYGFAEWNIENGEPVKYDQHIVSNLLCIDNISCIPLNMKDLACLHPNRNPTNGLMFLWEILRSQLFIDYEIFLVGFNFDEICSTHNPDWEQPIIQRWIKHGYFTSVMCTSPLTCQCHINTQ